MIDREYFTLVFKPSDIVRIYRSVSRSAAHVGQNFILDEKRLEPSFSKAQIDAIFAELEYIEGIERLIDGRLAALDALSPDGGCACTSIDRSHCREPGCGYAMSPAERGTP